MRRQLRVERLEDRTLTAALPLPTAPAATHTANPPAIVGVAAPNGPTGPATTANYSSTPFGGIRVNHNLTLVRAGRRAIRAR